MSVPITWKQENGKLAEALMGAEYAFSPRNLHTDAIIGDAIDAGKSIREVVDICAGLADSVEELVCMIWALGIYHGARGGHRS